MRVTVDIGACVSSGMCALLAPAVFDLDEEDGVVVLLAPEPAVAHHVDVARAVRGCPARAIAAEGAAGG